MDWEQRERSGDGLGIDRKEWRWTGNREKGVEMDWEQRERSGDGLGTGTQPVVGTQPFQKDESGLLWRDATLSTIVSSEFSRPISLLCTVYTQTRIRSPDRKIYTARLMYFDASSKDCSESRIRMFPLPCISLVDVLRCTFKVGFLDHRRLSEQLQRHRQLAESRNRFPERVPGRISTTRQ